MLQQQPEAATADTCAPEWVHLHHLVSYCTRTIPGILDPVNEATSVISPATTVCRRQNCVFRLKR